MNLGIGQSSSSRLKLSATLAFSVGTLLAGAASARGIAIDQGPVPTLTACSSLGGPCSASGLSGQFDLNNYEGSDPNPKFSSGIFNNLYIYDDGVVSIGKPLPSTASLAGGLASLGDSYIAAGFADLPAQGGFTMKVEVLPPFFGNDPVEPYAVNIDWIFNDSRGDPAILGLTLTDLSVDNNDGTVDPSKIGQVGVTIDFGAFSTSWFGTDYPNAYCDDICDSSGQNNPNNFDGDETVGVYLPKGAEIGSSFPGLTATTVDPSTYSFSRLSYTITYPLGGAGGGAGGVPEPATWAMMLLGFGGLGAAIRSRRARLATA